jgi:hypothetical protein
VVLTNYGLQPTKYPLVGHRSAIQLCEGRREILQETVKYCLVKGFLVLEVVVEAGGANTHTVCHIAQ